MLILTRRPGETVMIGDDVELTVLGVVGNQVRIGITAPKNVPVHRREIYERIKREMKGEPDGNSNETHQDPRPGPSHGQHNCNGRAILKVRHSARCRCQLCMRLKSLAGASR